MQNFYPESVLSPLDSAYTIPFARRSSTMLPDSFHTHLGPYLSSKYSTHNQTRFHVHHMCNFYIHPIHLTRTFKFFSVGTELHLNWFGELCMDWLGWAW